VILIGGSEEVCHTLIVNDTRDATFVVPERALELTREHVSDFFACRLLDTRD